jgi:hypothetical protein
MPVRPLPLVLIAGVCIAAGMPVASAGAAATRRGTLLFDAAYPHVKLVDKGPKGDSVGDREEASGTLRTVSGKKVGKFAFTCVWTKVSASGVLERCTGFGTTPAGKIALSGPSRQRDALHDWRVGRSTGAYAGSKGTVVVDDVTLNESVVEVSLRSAKRRAFSFGSVVQAPGNAKFIRSADGICRTTTQALDALPPFPFTDFDPLHPDPAVLPQVGNFFTGPGDPRPAQNAEVDSLTALGTPPSQGSQWARVIADMKAVVAGETAQDNAALASDVAGFVSTVNSAGPLNRRQGIDALSFGAVDCAV